MAYAPVGAVVADRLAAAGRRAREARVDDVRTDVHAARAAAGGTLDRDDAVLAGTLLATACVNAGRLADAAGELDTIRPLVPSTEPIRQARFHAIASYVAHCAGDDDDAITELTVALAILDGIREPSAELAAVLANCSTALGHTQLFPLGVSAADRAVAVAAAAGMPAGQFRFAAGHTYLTWAIRLDHLRLPEADDRWRSAVENLTAALEWTDVTGPLFAAFGQIYLARCHARLSRPEEARRCLDASLAVERRESTELLRLRWQVEGAVLLAEGRIAEARALLADAWPQTCDLHRPPWTEDVAYLLGSAAQTAGDDRAALRWYGQVHRLYGQREYEVALALAAAARLRVEQQALLRRSRQLESDSRSDPLTGVGNRRALDEALRRHLPTADLGPAASVVIVDIDRFKQINDTYGHPTGDQVLREVAGVLRGHLRAGEVCARYGGDEFVLVLALTAAEAAGVAERARVEVARQAWPLLAADLAVTVTCGVAQRRRDDTAAGIFAAADADLLAAKRARAAGARRLGS